jgi:predicted oxidoreductase (fatty acid repression mutant protein)
VGETPAVTLANLQTDFVQELVGKDIRHFNQLIDEALIKFPNLPGDLVTGGFILKDGCLFCSNEAGLGLHKI